MKVTVTAAGTRGDVQPCIALGLGLKRAGHAVTLASWEPYRRMAETRGLPFRPVAGPDPEDLVAALVESGRNPFEYARRFRPLLRPHVERGLRDCLSACRDADAVLYSPLGFAGFMAAEHLGLPSVGSAATPLFIRSDLYPSAVLGRPVDLPVLSRLYNRASHLAVEQIYWRTIAPLVIEARRSLGLSPLPALVSPITQIHRSRRPILLGWSRHVLPEDPSRKYRMPTTGYWFLDHDEKWRPPEKLRQFLDSGDPPVALGLGSLGHTTVAEAGRIVSLTAGALQKTGLRGVLISDHPGADDRLPENVVRIPGGVPYDWLFPKTSLIVHHGGAGTTAEALRSGKPSVTIPTVPDQSFWAHRLHTLGAAPPPIPHHALTANRLSEAIHQAATDPKIRQRSEILSEKITTEDGITRAVEAFEKLIAKG